VLLNFNLPSFIRNGLAALKVESLKEMEHDLSDEELSDIDPTMHPEDIDAIAGGACWREIIVENSSFQDKEAKCANTYLAA